MGSGQVTPEQEPSNARAEDPEQSRFVGFAKKLVRVPKKEIDEKAEEWKRERERERDR
jgi:hypothetical protein